MAARKTKSTKADRTELIEALNAIEKRETDQQRYHFGSD